MHMPNLVCCESTLMYILVGTCDVWTQSARAQSACARARIYIVLMGTTRKPKTPVLTF